MQSNTTRDQRRDIKLIYRVSYTQHVISLSRNQVQYTVLQRFQLSAPDGPAQGA